MIENGGWVLWFHDSKEQNLVNFIFNDFINLCANNYNFINLET